MSKRKLTEEEYREQRIRNLEANANNHCQSMLSAINKYGQMLERELSMIPTEFREMPNTAAHIIRAFLPTYTVGDFYHHSYEEEILPEIADTLFMIVRMMQAATDALIEQLLDLQHNYDPSDEDREEKIHILQQLVTRFENMTDEAARAHGSNVADTVVDDAGSYQFEHYDEFMKILDG